MSIPVLRLSRAGFTLMEILVAVVLIGLLAAAVLPTVVNQLGKGEVTRVADDLKGIETAAKMFRTDVNRWPSEVSQLAQTPGTGTAGPNDVYGSAISSGLVAKWSGPYIEQGAVRGDSLPSAMGGVIAAPFDTVRWGGSLFLAVKVNGISVGDAKRVSTSVDGDTVVRHATADNNGRVRWKAGDGTTPDTLVYLATSVQ